MSQQIVNTGIGINTGTGDKLPVLASKVNQNFAELYAAVNAFSAAGNTDLSASVNSTVVTISSSTGNSALISPATESSAGALQASDKLLINKFANLTINSTSFAGTANNTLYVGSTAAANVVSNAQLSSNLAGYANTTTPVLSSSLTVGNATVNVFANSTIIKIGNASVNVSINSTAFSGTANSAAYVGTLIAANVVSNVQLSSNLAGYVTTGALSGNLASYVTTAALSSILTNYADTIAPVLQTSMTVGNATVNVFVNSTSVVIGNSTVNTFANSTHFFSGNSTVYGFTNSTAEALVSTSGNATTTPTSFTILAPTGAGVISVGNTTINTTVNSTAVTLGVINTTAVGTLVNSSVVVIGNSSVNTTINSTAHSFGGTSYRIAVPTMSILTANFAMTNVATAQNCFPTGQRLCTLAASTTYLMEAQYIINIATATTPGSNFLSTSFVNSVAIGSCYYSATSGTSNNNDTSVNNFVTQVAAYSLGATQVTPSTAALAQTTRIKIRGYLATGASAPNLTPQITFSAQPNATPTMLTGSFICFTPIGNGTVNAIGSWA